eukprot:CAMPEP_0197409502 /NCGR_PEP_ID=MMETSP1165-20131217/30017_1 /TAXON_ID=284809 /ORGANISM="Chrysocystis fragilis, Strain CCMP3189" /LENGTH=186 /DNA_ID=CAMNT_0042935967 /DNA_START=80 /DNA_END=637 /DNA_ORIENTATION=-
MAVRCRERYVLTEEEVVEDEENESAQRRAIKYCVEQVYYSAPVKISAVATPGHHMKSALITVDEEERFLPESCLVDPSGNVLVTPYRGGSAGGDGKARELVTRKHAIAAAALSRVREVPVAPAAPAASRVTASEVEVCWEPPAEATWSLVTKYEAAFLKRGARQARWVALGTVEVLRGEVLTARAA